MPLRPQSSRPSADTDQMLVWLFGLALGLWLLLRWWPDEPAQSTYSYTYPEAPAVYEETPAVQNEAAPEPAPSTQDEWQQGNTFRDYQPTPAEPLPAGEEDKVYTYVEQMPEPPGGPQGLDDYLRDNVKYPAEARYNNVAGKVLVTFVVGTDGQVRDARVEQGIGAGCDKEAVQVISRMPAWTPGRQNGQPVSVQYTVPVTFPPNW
jgi:TonB family protein